MALSLGLQGELNHYDGVFLHVTEQQYHPYHANQHVIRAAEPQRQQREHADRNQGRQNSHGMNKAFVKHPEDGINAKDSGSDQPVFAGGRVLKQARFFLKTQNQTFRQRQLGSDLFYDSQRFLLSVTLE